jgi:hypothetical protein
MTISNFTRDRGRATWITLLTLALFLIVAVPASADGGGSNSGSGKSGSGSSNSGPGSSNSGPGSSNSGPGSSNSGPGSSNSGPGSSNSGPGSSNSGRDNNGMASFQNTRTRTPLAGNSIAGELPKAHAEFRNRADRGRTRLNVEVEDVNLPAGTVLTVVFEHNGASTTLGTIQLDAFHAGELELNSEDGDMVPAVQPGDTVSVFNGNVKILTGVF